MRYLRGFNENKEEFKDRFYEAYEVIIPWFIDNGYEVSMQQRSDYIMLLNIKRYSAFKIGDIKEKILIIGDYLNIKSDNIKFWTVGNRVNAIDLVNIESKYDYILNNIDVLFIPYGS